MQNILNEVYFGKDQIQPVFIQFKKTRASILDKTWTNKINTSKEVIKLNRALENFFGFNTFTLTIVPDQSMNACAIEYKAIMTRAELQRIVNSVRSCKQGFKFNKKEAVVDAAIIFNMGLIGDELFTDEECFGVLLHEIGHCFFSAIEDKDTIFTANMYNITTLKQINALIKEKITKGIVTSADRIRSEVSTINPLKRISRVFNFVKVQLVGEKLKRKFFKEDNADNMNRRMYDYSNEKFADTFATMYGYGIHMHKALIKSNQEAFDFYKLPKYQKSNNSFINFIKLNILLSQTMQEYYGGVQDPHPNNLHRVAISIQFIRKELAKQHLDPKLKLQLSQQLNDLQALMDDFINYSEDEDNMYLVREYYKALYDKYSGDPREQDADNDALFDEIEKRYNSLFTKSK
jgi:hypothetical protein